MLDVRQYWNSSTRKRLQSRNLANHDPNNGSGDTHTHTHTLRVEYYSLIWQRSAESRTSSAESVMDKKCTNPIYHSIWNGQQNRPQKGIRSDNEGIFPRRRSFRDGHESYSMAQLKYWPMVIRKVRIWPVRYPISMSNAYSVCWIWYIVKFAFLFIACLIWVNINAFVLSLDTLFEYRMINQNDV